MNLLFFVVIGPSKAPKHDYDNTEPHIAEFLFDEEQHTQQLVWHLPIYPGIISLYVLTTDNA